MGCPFFFYLSKETRFTQQYEILLWNIRDSKLSYGKNRRSLSHLCMNRYLIDTDRQRETDGLWDRITAANKNTPAAQKKNIKDITKMLHNKNV